MSLPGAWKFSVAGLIARYPMSLLGLGIVLFVQAVSKSYGLAGALSAVYLLAFSVSNPVLAKLVDRRGQSRVMVPVTVVHVLATVAMIICVYQQLWWAVFLVTAVIGATMGSVGSMVRARWAYIAPTPKHFSTALSWESVADEALFVTGPVTVTLLATAIIPPLGIIASSAMVTLGAILFYPQKATEPPITVVDPTTPKGRVLSNPAIFLVVISHLFVGINFGAIDVATVAFAQEQGVKEFAGLALGIYAVGSLVAGMVYGAITWEKEARRRFAIGLGAMALGAWAFQLVTTFVMLCVLVFFLGLAVAPSLIAASSIIEKLAPPRRLTEAFAWISTMMSVGVAVGSALAGAVVDRFDAVTSFLVPAFGSSLAAVVIVGFYRIFDPEVSAETSEQRVVLDTGEVTGEVAGEVTGSADSSAGRADSSAGSDP